MRHRPTVICHSPDALRSSELLEPPASAGSFALATLGTIQERYAYDSYGNLSIFDGVGASRSATDEGNRYTYTSREWDDELGLYHFRRRFFDPNIGRFCSKDPIGYEGGINLFGFLDNSPLDSLDPSGESGFDSIEHAIAQMAPRLALAIGRYKLALSSFSAAAARYQRALCSGSQRAIQQARLGLQQARTALSQAQASLRTARRDFLQLFGSHQQANAVRTVEVAIRENARAADSVVSRLNAFGPRFNQILIDASTKPGTCRTTAQQLAKVCPKNIRPKFIRVWCKEGGPLCQKDGTMIAPGDHVVIRCGNYVYDAFNRQGIPFEVWLQNLISNRLIDNPTICTEVLRTVK